jgi:hypothetical protein
MPDDHFELSLDDVLDLLKDASSQLSDTSPGLGAPSPRDAYETALEIFRDTIAALPGDVLDLSVDVTPPQAWVADQLQFWKDKVKDLEDQLKDLTDGQPPAPTAPASPAIDPLLPLERIAQAINAAEKNLNQENLVISSGSIEVTLNVDVGGVAGAAANIKFNIAPRPYQ